MSAWKAYITGLALLFQLFSGAEEDEFKARFAVPPSEYRILPIVHNLPKTPEEQDAQRATLRAKGFGGVTCNVSFDGYLEDEAAWTSFLRGVREAKKEGMALWLYDERGYPSGSAGGLTLRDHPEWEARGIYAAEASSSGDAVVMPIPPGNLVRAAAFPMAADGIRMAEAIELGEHIQDGTLHWTPGPGQWRVLVLTEHALYDNTHAAVSLAEKYPYINLLMPEPTARFIELTHAEYARRLDSNLGNWFMATFMDEPSLMSLFMRQQPYLAIPWAPNLAPEFQARRGRALEPLLPALFIDAGAPTARARHDFWKTVGELVAENFAGQIQTFCRAHGIPSGGHFLMEESFLCHVPLYGHFMQCLRRLDAPSMDCLTSLPEGVPWATAKLVGSVADLEGRTLTMSETSDHSQQWRAPGDARPPIAVTEAQIRGTCNRQMAFGINTITSYYRFAGLDDPALNRLNEWVGRCALLLRGGHQVNGVAMLYPAESAWAHFAPSTLWNEDAPPKARRIDAVFSEVSQQFYRAGLDFTYVDAQALQEARAEEGALRLRDMAWRVLVLPQTDTLPQKAWDAVHAFWKQGGMVLALGALPANNEHEFPSAAVQAMARELFGESGVAVQNESGGVGLYLETGLEMLAPEVVDAHMARDARVEGNHPHVHVTRRNVDGHDVFFAFNDAPDAWNGHIQFAGTGDGEQWDPATGQISPCGRSVNLNLEPYGGCLFRFQNTPLPERPSSVSSMNTAGNAGFSIRYQALPPCKPTGSHGEFIPGELTDAPEHAAPERAAWRAAGTISKSGEDTFFFASFDYPAPVDISGACSLAVEVWKPAGQDCKQSILMIVADQNGAEFIGDSRQSLGDEGWVRCNVPLSAFTPASWGVQGRGACDWSAVKAIRVGWGGYHGESGEPVEFVTRAPETGRINR